MNEKIKKLINEIVTEISTDLRDRTMDAMKTKGMDNRARTLLNNDLVREFKGKRILVDDEEQVIIDIRIKDQMVVIEVGNSDNLRHEISGDFRYYINEDKYELYGPVNRQTARMLSKIATNINPNSQYSNGVGDFKIKGW